MTITGQMLNKIDEGNLQKQRIFLEIRKSSTLKTFVPSLSNSSVQTHNMTCKQERNIWSWGSLCLYKVSPLLDVKPPYDPACPSNLSWFCKIFGKFHFHAPIGALFFYLKQNSHGTILEIKFNFPMSPHPHIRLLVGQSINLSVGPNDRVS